MRHVPISRDDLQPINGFAVTDYVIEVHWSVFLDPL